MLAGWCDRCGFEPEAWTDAAAVMGLATMPERWTSVLNGLPDVRLATRQFKDTWSIAEYVDHVRETMFVMRFLLDVAVSTPEVDLGPVEEPAFDREPRRIDSQQALRAFVDEVRQLCAGLREVTAATTWDTGVVVGGRRVDVHWIARNALHESRHHLGDVERLREVILTQPGS